jgi:hypothetical protein
MIAHPAPSVHSHARLVTWLHCAHCYTGYFAAGVPHPQPGPACAGDRLQPAALWDLCTEAAPAGMLWRGEV